MCVELYYGSNTIKRPLIEHGRCAFSEAFSEPKSYNGVLVAKSVHKKTTVMVLEMGGTCLKHIFDFPLSSFAYLQCLYSCNLHICIEKLCVTGHLISLTYRLTHG